MRYIKVSIVPLFLILLAVTALPTFASDIHTGDFDSWVKKKSGEFDERWTRIAAREAGTAVSSAPDGTMTLMRHSTVRRGTRPANRISRPKGRSNVKSTGIDGSRFTKRGSQDFLWRTTTDRNGPSRGLDKLTSPSQATRASSFDRRLPHNTSSKYKRSTGYSRAGAWRKSPRMGGRISSTRSRGRSPSMTRGASRTRRSARRGF